MKKAQRKGLASNHQFTDTLSHPGILKFLLFLGLMTGALIYCYWVYFLGSTFYEAYLNLSVRLVVELLTVWGEQITLGRLPNGLMGEINSHDGATVRFTEGSDGLVFVACLVSAIVAWPGSFFKKSIAVCLGVASVFLLNIMRVALMLKIDIYLPLYFDLINSTIMPLILAGLSVCLFFWWTHWSGRHPVG